MGGNLTMNLWIRMNLETELSALLQRKVEISYSSLSCWDGDGRMGQVKIGNPPEYQDPNMLTVKNLVVNIEPLSLLSDTIVVESLTLIKPELKLNGSNFSDVAEHLAKVAGNSNQSLPDLSGGHIEHRKIIIEKISAEDGVITDNDGNSRPFPQLSLKDLSNSDGYTPAAILSAIAGQIEKSISGK